MFLLIFATVFDNTERILKFSSDFLTRPVRDPSPSVARPFPPERGDSRGLRGCLSTLRTSRSPQCACNHLKNKKMKQNHSERTDPFLRQKKKHLLSIPFMLMAILFNVCLIASNLFETKLFMAGSVALTGGVIIFPVSYILNDCIVEVWGYKKARLVIWTGFAMNFFVVLTAQIVRLLPAAPFWDGGPHFDYVFAMAPKVVAASLLAFLSGSTMNAYVMSRMKVASGGKKFSLRAIVSSIAGESIDSLIFFPIAFWGIGMKDMLALMVTQIFIKTFYEVIILPVTNYIVAAVKKYEGEDAFDEDISYNPFRIADI